MKFNNKIFAACLLLGAAFLTSACGKKQAAGAEASVVIPAEPFSVSLVPEAGVDSATRAALLYVAIDDHFAPHTDTLPGDLERCWRLDSLRPDTDGRYALNGTSRDVAEIYIITPSGKVRMLYAVGGENYTWSYDNAEISADDALNGWLSATVQALQAMSADSCRRAVDSICRTDADLIRPALLVRELLPTVSDTLFLRRCLGRLKSSAKPSWLMYDIDRRMDERYRVEYSGFMKRNYNFRDAKGETFNFSTLNRSNLLVFFWADYDEQSVTALSRMKAKSEKVDVFTFCLHAADSAAWRKSVSSLPGRNVWLTDGLNHPMLQVWGVDRPGQYVLLNTSAHVLYRGADENRLTQKLDSIYKPRAEKPRAKR